MYYKKKTLKCSHLLFLISDAENIKCNTDCARKTNGKRQSGNVAADGLEHAPAVELN